MPLTVTALQTLMVNLQQGKEIVFLNGDQVLVFDLLVDCVNDNCVLVHLKPYETKNEESS